MIIRIDMDGIYGKLIKKPSNNNSEYAMSMESDLREDSKTDGTKCKSSDSEEKRCKIKCYKECKSSLRYKKTNFCVFGRVF